MLSASAVVCLSYSDIYQKWKKFIERNLVSQKEKVHRSVCGRSLFRSNSVSLGQSNLPYSAPKCRSCTKLCELHKAKENMVHYLLVDSSKLRENLLNIFLYGFVSWQGLHAVKKMFIRTHVHSSRSGLRNCLINPAEIYGEARG